VLLHGVELNIGRDGELDYDAEFRRSFDWCLASVHDHFELGASAQTRARRHARCATRRCA
jgi:DNA polymerase (family 10)